MEIPQIKPQEVKKKPRSIIKIVGAIILIPFCIMVLIGKYGAQGDINFMKSKYVDNCLNGGDETKRTYCECVFDGLVDKYTWESFSKMGKSPELSQSTKDIGYKCMGKKEGYLVGDDLKETYKSSYIKSCTETGASENTCACYVDFLIEKLGVEGFGEMGKVLDEKPVNSPEVKKYLDIVSEQKVKCGSLIN